MNFDDVDLSAEISYKTSRSGGKGGQHVNKTETKVTLVFNVQNSNLLTAIQKERILLKLRNRISQEGNLIISNSESRSQLKNKELVTQQLYSILQKALLVNKKRKPSKPSKAANAKRLLKKKRLSEKKSLRKKDF
ncbi:alternative ribosome rescue aminoacyl-tRNA hydrolase ArfB [Acidiluteibacter ferrifornacis]|jgi:ribosome-associated protein|uniref:Aminoacyl-tRNA hydrolase n=1 Tax=Acidiluteibacter ferrifornacis TaxID=2692424 RepID=A0A6N9NMD4_9FLAO|nr:alternative ribosome rescue aminoacyl-tRNA hydrolase ArfB [Acidiluteibacter ferrifornacis]MBR9833083.1 aminoacyl-tRNA hydrolase [bacterium]NBG66267.1 aminoacyl-tRNA hydrolase [Acidiluteibacter ferrifornacis]